VHVSKAPHSLVNMVCLHVNVVFRVTDKLHTEFVQLLNGSLIM